MASRQDLARGTKAGANAASSGLRWHLVGALFESDLMSTVIRIGDLGVQHGSEHLRQTGGRLRDECLLSA